MKNILSCFDSVLQYSMRIIAISCFLLLFILLAGNVLIRNFPIMEIYWFDEVVEFAFAWMVFIGAAKLWANNEHFRLKWLSGKIENQKAHHLFTLAIETVSIIFLFIFTYQSFQLTMLARDWTPVLNLSKRFLYVCMPISGAIMVGYSIRAMFNELVHLKNLSTHHK
ncbi:MAG: TRAP transporter small permease [Desulfobacteraceae bacterium]|nr:TRAP transporter small permease [Desulfobacteraceae bacterium]